MARRRHNNEIPTVNQIHEGFAEMKAEVQADYRAARTSRFRKKLVGVSAAGSHADYHYRNEADYYRLMELGRSLDRDDIVVGQGIDRLVNNCIPPAGIPLNPQTGEEGLNEELSGRWDEYAKSARLCHKGAEFPLHAQARMSLRHMIVDGDCFVVQDQDGTQELVEGHRVRSPRNTKRRVVHGVLLDEHRKHLEVWITKEDVEPWKAVIRVNETAPFKVWDDEGYRIVQQVYNPKRISQTRGVTIIARMLDAAMMHDDIQFAKMVQQQIVSCFAFLRKPAVTSSGGEIGFHGDRSEQTLADGTTRTIEGLGPGLEITGRPGEEITGFSPAVPNPEFKTHAMLILTLIAVNLDLPLAVLLLDPTMTNFSGWRGAIDQARVGFTALQQLLIRQFYTPIYANAIRGWVADTPSLGRSVAPVKLFAHEFTPPGWTYIEPLKDASADLMRVRNGLTSPRRYHRSRGTNWVDVSTEIVEDNALAIRKAKEAAAEINNEFTDDNPVHWRELLSLPLPDGMKMAIKVAPDKEEDDDANERDADARERRSA